MIAKRDKNERAILDTLADLGVFYRQMPPETGFDLLLAWRGRCWIVEIKNGTLPPSKRTLTPNEVLTRAALLAVGVEYHVCNDLDEVLHVLGVTPCPT